MSRKQKSENRVPDTLKVKDFYCKTSKQETLVEAIKKYEVTIAAGVAGSGKTIVTLATAIDLLGTTYKRIILVKSVVNPPNEEIGFIPGTIAQKMDPYLMSYTINIDKLCGKDASKDFMSKGLIEVLPLSFIRGVSLDNAIVIVDETQNISPQLFKTLISRIGTDSKYVFLGDIEQIDLRKKNESCLSRILEIFKDSEIIGTVWFDDSDCVRNPIIPKIIEILRENNI